MTVEARFLFAQGITKAIRVPVGTIAWAERHLARLREVFFLDDDRADWYRQVGHVIADGKTITDDALCDIATKHDLFVDAMWSAIANNKEHTGKTERLTPKKAAQLWPGFTMQITVPANRWTADYYQAQMEHAYEVMRGRESCGESLSYGEPLTERQAAAVIILFSQWLDHHDIRLDVPLDHDHLGRSDTGDYDWCSDCGPIDSDESFARAQHCPKGAECCLRESFGSDEFEDEDNDD
jgi:hypothetical protein